MTTDSTATPSTFAFKAEVQKVLSLVINSLYTNPEVFLRELVSNASDALDKARFLQLTAGNAVVRTEEEPAIRITLDEEHRSLTIEDNGVGMTRDEVIENLGTIARSGTSEFFAKFAEASKSGDKDRALELIGQFGVGFYAVFMVADRVDVDTRSIKAGSEPVLWRSAGDGEFTIAAGERAVPGTRITLHLKEDAAEFAEEWRVEHVIEKYSNFVMFPIHVGDKVVNRSSALWRLPKSKVTDEQHVEFFKLVTNGTAGDAPLATIHWSVDAPVQFSALVYVPSKATMDLFSPRQLPGLRLYAKRVLIMESCDKLLPTYLRFLRGVVDSEDVQLNVSRETLQENRTIRQIEQQLTKQALKALEALAADEPEKYLAFWRQFGVILKEGVSTDFRNKDLLAKLYRFQSLRAPKDSLLGLEDYVKAKPEAQRAIYYLTGNDLEQLKASPLLEAFRARDLDVLLLTDPIDEWMVNGLRSFEGLDLVSVAHGELDLDAIAKPKTPEPSPADDARTKAAVAALERVLADRVVSVRASRRLTETASCLVSRQGDPSANLERLMKAFDEDKVEAKKRILEVNPSHPIVESLGLLAERDPASPRIQLFGEMLYDQALLSEGVVEDPARLVRRIQDLLVESARHAAAAVEAPRG
jgi:molecular chaperone HtpG